MNIKYEQLFSVPSLIPYLPKFIFYISNKIICFDSNVSNPPGVSKWEIMKGKLGEIYRIGESRILVADNNGVREGVAEE